ncbi:PhzF family phenazine biosynthesis isomerase [Lysinibacillus sp. KU-BSD001]|uniref:PhzF family phenazine biosynthesis protein n=1 Tax=Lysinibacillus sp. KU-BSD001 TaxID=3141328 RepID=UPI0036E8AE19
MKKEKVLHIDAFSTKPNKGNPAGVVLNGQDYTELEMQLMAKKVGFSETAFVLPSEVADYRIRFFTPGFEANLCGHATIGTVFAMKEAGMMEQNRFSIETKAGILPIEVREEEGQILITMQQAAPEFIPFEGSIAELAASIGLGVDELDERYPVMYGSTGNWTLIVPIKKLESFSKMQPQQEKFPALTPAKPNVSIHPLCLDVYDAESTMHGRHFSSPSAGILEDPVTGTASGVMGAYYKQFIKPDFMLPATFIVEQGHEMNKEGKVYVHVNEGISISISGTAVFSGEILVTI